MIKFGTRFKTAGKTKSNNEIDTYSKQLSYRLEMKRIIYYKKNLFFFY